MNNKLNMEFESKYNWDEVVSYVDTSDPDWQGSRADKSEFNNIKKMDPNCFITKAFGDGECYVSICFWPTNAPASNMPPYCLWPDPGQYYIFDEFKEEVVDVFDTLEEAEEALKEIAEEYLKEERVELEDHVNEYLEYRD